MAASVSTSLNKSKIKYRFAILFCLLLCIATISGSMSRPPRNNDVNNMADALKYLQDLDSYYASVARPRYGKRSFFQFLKERAATASQDDIDATGKANFYPKDELF